MICNSAGIAPHLYVSPEVAGFIACHADHLSVDVLKYDLTAFQQFSCGPVFIESSRHGEEVVGCLAVWPVADAAVLPGIVSARSCAVVFAGSVARRGRLQFPAFGREIGGIINLGPGIVMGNA